MTSPLDLESFAAHVEAATRTAGFAVEKREGAVLTVVLHGRPMRCDLRQMIYGTYRKSPNRLEDIVQAHLAALRQVPPPPPQLTEQQAAEALLPLLQQARWLDLAQLQNGTPLVHRPLTGGLVVTYVFDLPDSRAYINATMMEKMSIPPVITPDTIYAYALENLRKRTSSRDYKTLGIHDGTVVVCETKDGYAATRVLLPELMELWAGRIPGRMLLGIPNRDFLIAFSDRNPDQVAAMAQQVRRDATKRDHPLSASLLTWKDGRISEYRPRF
ncbi:MAG: DUF1444 family protein [Chloroflexi bacterium]|nr:DUF1444 family protein [Chloroflexota bacterium]